MARTYEGVAVILARVTPAILHNERLDEFRDVSASALRVPPESILTYGCMGRQDLLLLVRTRRLEDMGMLPRPRGVRKTDIQYGYMGTEAADALFDADRDRSPLVAGVYGKVSDEVVAASASRLPLEAISVPVGPMCHMVRLLGWNDVLVLGEASSVSELLTWASGLWDAPASAAGGPAIHDSSPLFARTYSVVGFRLGRGSEDRFGSLSEVDEDDDITAPRIEMRIRTGHAHHVRVRAAEMLSLGDVTPEFHQELGHEDGTISFSRPGTDGIPRLNASVFLQAYYTEFLKEVRNCVHSTQLCLALRRDDSEADPKTPMADPSIVDKDLSFPYIDLAAMVDPKKGEVPNPVGEALAGLLDHDITASAADCLHALYEACDWSIENEALQTTFGDLHWHLRFLLQEEWPETVPTIEDSGRPALGAFAETLGAEMKALGECFAQRLSGVYYGVMGYRPEHLFSHATSLHKIPVGLWALHSSVLEALTGADGFRPSGCWVVSHGQRPFVGAPDTRGACKQVGQLPSRGVAAIERICVDISHEIGHIIYNRYVSRSDDDSHIGGAIPYGPGLWIPFFQTALDHHLPSDLTPSQSTLARKLSRESFADAFGMTHFLSERFELLARRVLEYLPWQQDRDSAELVLRAFVQYITVAEPGVDATGGRIPASDDWLPQKGEMAKAWVERVTDTRHHLTDSSLWEAFWAEMTSIADRHCLPIPTAEQLGSGLAFLHRLEPSATAVLAHHLECAVVAGRGHSERAKEGRRTHEKRARRAFEGLVAAWAGEADDFDSRMECCEALWELAVRLLVPEAGFRPREAGGVPAERGSPWLSFVPQA